VSENISREELAGKVRAAMSPPTPRMTSRTRKRIEAEVKARWPYYRKHKDYRALAERHAEVERIQEQAFDLKMRCTGLDAQDVLKDVEDTLKKIGDGMLALSREAHEMFGLFMVISPKLTVEQILADDLLASAFDALRAAWCSVDESPPLGLLGGPGRCEYLAKYTQLPVELYLSRPKREILADVGAIIDAWKGERCKEGLFRLDARRDRRPDTSLYSQYVKAYELRQSNKTYRQIAVKLFPREEPEAAIQKAELYTKNGELLLRGNSDQIGRRWKVAPR
jgi:hypothetical protein